ncbi:hypothetical protein J6590_023345 [Homalodisca vitripennis]|nr:hypothetical protein J6590_023345 [Homalodisca vitripennis]
MSCGTSCRWRSGLPAVCRVRLKHPEGPAAYSIPPGKRRRAGSRAWRVDRRLRRAVWRVWSSGRRAYRPIRRPENRGTGSSRPENHSERRAVATDLGACPRPTALPRASVTAGTQLTSGTNSRAARVARLRRPYGPASNFLGPCRLSCGKHFASPGVSKTNCVF